MADPALLTVEAPEGRDPAARDASTRTNWPLTILAILGVIGAIVVGRAFLMPVFLAFLLSLTFSPIRRAMQRRKVPPFLTAFVVVTLLLVVAGGLVYALSGPVQNYAENGKTIVSDVERKLRGVSEAIEKVSEASDTVEQMADGPAKPDADVQRVVVDGPSLLTRFATTAPWIVAQTVFTLVLLFFLIASGDMFYEKLVAAAPTFRDKKRAISIAYDIERKLSRYFLTIAVINAGLGVAIGTALWLIGMPNPLLFGVVAFILNFVPYLGAITGVAATTFLAIVSFDTVGDAFLAGGLYLALTTLEGQFITPYAVGRSLELNPVLVFIAVAFWGWAWSVIGMIIAVPALITLRVFAEYIPKLQSLAIFLSGESAEEASR